MYTSKANTTCLSPTTLYFTFLHGAGLSLWFPLKLKNMLSLENPLIIIFPINQTQRNLKNSLQWTTTPKHTNFVEVSFYHWVKDCTISRLRVTCFCLTNHRLVNSNVPSTYPKWSHGNMEHKKKLRGMYSTKARSEENTQLKPASGCLQRKKSWSSQGPLLVLHRPQVTARGYLLQFCDAHGIRLAQERIASF